MPTPNGKTEESLTDYEGVGRVYENQQRVLVTSPGSLKRQSEEANNGSHQELDL